MDSVYPIQYSQLQSFKRARTCPPLLSNRWERLEVDLHDQEDSDDEVEERVEMRNSSSIESKLYIEMNSVLRELHSQTNQRHSPHQSRNASNPIVARGGKTEIQDGNNVVANYVLSNRYEIPLSFSFELHSEFQDDRGCVSGSASTNA